jgi:hypothetical protein
MAAALEMNGTNAALGLDQRNDTSLVAMALAVALGAF